MYINYVSIVIQCHKTGCSPLGVSKDVVRLLQNARGIESAQVGSGRPWTLQSGGPKWGVTTVDPTGCGSG